MKNILLIALLLRCIVSTGNGDFIPGEVYESKIVNNVVHIKNEFGVYKAIDTKYFVVERLASDTTRQF